jgi:hypothetical protein
MKKLLFLAVLLGLTGCGETDQNDTSQSTLQSSPASVNYRMAASASTMGAPAASFGGWNPIGLKPVGASSLLNASKTIGGIAVDSHALISPAVKDVTKVLVRGAGGLALSVAVEELLGAVDWVMDPANNQIRYKPDTTFEEVQPSDKYFYDVNNCSFSSTTSPCYKKYASTPEYACKLYTSDYASDPEHRYLVKNGSCYGYSTYWGEYLWPLPINRHPYPNYDPEAKPEEKTLPLDEVSQKIIDNAEAENADAQAVTLAAAQAIVSEAENDAEKAEPIVKEFEDNSTKKCPSGITNNGSCWVCSRESWAPIRGRVVYAKDVVFGLSKCSAAMNSSQLLTRYKAFSELGAARDVENSCWVPQDQNHLQEAIEAKQTAAECNTYLGILGQ